MLEDDEDDAAVNTEIETEVAEPEVQKKTTKVATKRETSREEKRQPTLEELLEVKSEAIERRKENKALKGTVTDLEKQISELITRMESQQADFDSVKKAHQDRIVRATLLSELSKTGCVKPEMALGMIAKDVKFDKNGDVANTDELIESFKAENAFFFTGPATSQTEHQAPKPTGQVKNIVAGMDKKQVAEELRKRGVQFGL